MGLRRSKSARRTSAMTTARKAFAGPGCKIFFPFNEGYGDIFSDIVGGAQIQVDEVDHATYPHGPKIGMAEKALYSGSFPTVHAGKKVFFGKTMFVTSSPSFSIVSIGRGNNTPDIVDTCGFDADTGAAVRTYRSTGAVVPNGDTYFFTEGGADDPDGSASDLINMVLTSAATYDSVTNVMKAFSGRDHGGVKLTDTTLCPDGHQGGAKIQDTMKLGQVSGLGPAVYSVWMYIVDDLPSDSEIITGLNWMDAAHSLGHKELYPGFESL